jgi:hypothetical protein
MDAWEPMFSVSLGIPPAAFAELSLVQMIDHVEYARRGDDGRQ